jgi:hypothetical protein
MHAFGGIKRAFDNETKTRNLVENILIDAIGNIKDVIMDMEINLHFFEAASCRPDIVILEKKD